MSSSKNKSVTKVVDKVDKRYDCHDCVVILDRIDSAAYQRTYTAVDTAGIIKFSNFFL